MVEINGWNFTIGADPELFLFKKSEKDGPWFISAEGYVGGTKKEPKRVKNGTIQLDGTAAEIGIDPANTEEEFCSNIKSVLGQLKQSLPPDVYLSASPVADFKEDVWKSVSNSSKRLGCDPDFNAYTGKANPTPDGKRTYRTGAGHIHIGWGFDEQDPMNPTHFEQCRYLSMYMDYFVQYPLSKVANDYRRMSLYGSPGAFRPKPFGVEYRSPSNFWLSSPERVAFVYRQTLKSIQAAMNGSISKKILFSNWYNFNQGDNTKCP